MDIGSVIMKKRKEKGITQAALAEKLNVSYQAVSKWEQSTACPEISLLPALSEILETSIDSLFGYKSPLMSDYEERYQAEDFYWGLEPNGLCYEIMKLKPPVKPIKVLDIGCGEGKDAIFLARNGYSVSAFDMAENGLEKGKSLAKQLGVNVDFFRADIMDYHLHDSYDVIFSSGVFHFIKPDFRSKITENIKEHTNKSGLCVINVFVDKPFIETPPDKTDGEDRFRWKSGELFMHFHKWYFHKLEEVVFDCNSGGIPHKHCMDIMIAEKS